MPDRVLVTGISGFLGGHLALQLLAGGYAVRGSVRSLDKAGKVRKTLAAHGADLGRLEIIALDLMHDAGWDAAVAGCRFVQHVASPFVIETPRDRSELIVPAVEGTRRAVSAALAAGVERIVLSSSIAAIVYGHTSTDRVFTGADWTRLDGRPVPAYQESKLRAEQEAWRLADAAGAREKLVAINPGAILGTLLDDDPGTSGALVQRLLNGAVPAAPRISFSIVDVRDVAAAEIAAMTAPGVGGQRIILSDRELSIIELADGLRAALPAYTHRLPRFELPDWLVRLAANFHSQLRENIGELGNVRRVDGAPGRALLGRPTIPAHDAALATALSLIAHGLVRS